MLHKPWNYVPLPWHVDLPLQSNQKCRKPQVTTPQAVASSLCLPAGQKIVHYPSSVCVQVATEWLYSVPDHILDRHLAADPSTPKTTTSVGAAAIDRNRALVPGRVPLQVWTLVSLDIWIAYSSLYL